MSLSLPSAATAFSNSIGITIGGSEVKHFNNVQVSYSTDGTGEKGIISQQLSFNVPAAEYLIEKGGFPYGTEVVVTCGLSLPKFYLYSQKPNGKTVSIVCYDRAMFTSEKLTISEDDFYSALTSKPSDWETNYKNYYVKSDNGYSNVTGSSAPEFSSGKYYSGGYISVSSVIRNICSVCDISSINTGEIIGKVITRMPKDSVYNKTAKAVLSELAEASAGCFYVQKNNGLSFIPFASGSVSAEFPVSKYEAVCGGASRNVSCFMLRNGDRIYSSGSGSGALSTMVIDTVMASAELVGALMNAYSGKTYTAWKCNNALVDHYPAPGAGIIFGDSEDVLVCNFCRLKLTSSGFFASMGRNDVSESEYISEYSRALEERVKIGEVNGNTKVTRDGVKLVYINENEGKAEEYGFKTFAGGVAEFAGSMLSAVQPVGMIEETADNVVSFIGTLGGKKFRWKSTEAEDGTVTLEREEVVESG